MDTNQVLNAVKQFAHPVVVYISLEDDGNRKNFEPELLAVVDRFKGRVDFIHYSVTASDPILREMFVLEVPTLVVYNCNREVARLVGNQPLDALEGLFELGLHDTHQTGGLHLSLFDRLVRMMIGLAIIILGYSEGQSWVIIGLGLILILLAFVDRFVAAYRSLLRRIKKT